MVSPVVGARAGNDFGAELSRAVAPPRESCAVVEQRHRVADATGDRDDVLGPARDASRKFDGTRLRAAADKAEFG